MKLSKCFLLFIAISSSAFSLNALAADETATLTVVGDISPSACTPNLDGGGKIDYGHIDASMLKATDPDINVLPVKTVNLTVNCTAAMKVAFTVADNRSDSMYVSSSFVFPGMADNGSDIPMATSTDGFGLGKTASDYKIGDYAITVPLTITADSNTVDVIGSSHGGDWAKVVGGNVLSGNARRETIAATGTLEPLAFTQAIFPLQINTGIRGLSLINSTGDIITLDGNATISLVYL
ncbi:DUF1120 domain-containing protein (plasmid) [Hafnia alvei]|uniref:DUF1120 domain-containing protein n=1 Tax=Hafnia alvei TaxID=569 RepID=UPI0016431D85|nr:DUF1120 domain-containing protein [Hafnia alvei]MBI0278626.1 DUF1120 domain-containing protein [Hafnia alvei]